MIQLHSDNAGRLRIRTTIGVPVGTRPRLSPEACAAVTRNLLRGPFLAAFEAVDCVRDIADETDRAHLMWIEDDDLLDAIDRDREQRKVW